MPEEPMDVWPRLKFCENPSKAYRSLGRRLEVLCTF
jgi:hypothetical protein